MSLQEGKHLKPVNTGAENTNCEVNERACQTCSKESRPCTRLFKYKGTEACL